MISPNYLKVLQHEHQRHPWGYWGYERAPDIRSLVQEQGWQSVLDYGCGSTHGVREWAKQHGWAVDLREYDPAVLGYEKKPSPADLVICIDVMEHVEEQYVKRVLDHIQALAVKSAWFTIALEPAGRTLALTGQNAHVTLHSHQWWLPKLRERFDTDQMLYDHGKLEFRGRPLPLRRSRRLAHIQDLSARARA